MIFNNAPKHQVNMQLRNRYYDSSSQKVIEPKTCSQKRQKKLVDLAKANVRRGMVTCLQKKVKYYETKTKSKTSRNTSSVVVEDNKEKIKLLEEKIKKLEEENTQMRALLQTLL
jgi:hypothetical protein